MANDPVLIAYAVKRNSKTKRASGPASAAPTRMTSARA